MISVVDIGLGNVRSVVNMFKKIGIKAELAKVPEGLSDAEKIVLPGVGHFAEGMRRLKDSGFREALVQRVIKDRIPTLGLCLGMQLFTEYSEEGGCEGLGWIEASTVRFQFQEMGERLRIPHMGWNDVVSVRTHPVFPASDEERRFYFVHTYFVKPAWDEYLIGVTKYGLDFCSILAKNNILGCQFHPEKSHRFGMQVFKDFAAWQPEQEIFL